MDASVAAGSEHPLMRSGSKMRCSNGDFEDYWRYHLVQERRRVHQSRYAGHVIPRAA